MAGRLALGLGARGLVVLALDSTVRHGDSTVSGEERRAIVPRVIHTMSSLKYVVAMAMALAGCTARTVDSDVCSKSLDPGSCVSCIGQPPRNVGGLPVKETYSGPSGAMCSSDGLGMACRASYFDGTATITAVCGDP